MRMLAPFVAIALAFGGSVAAQQPSAPASAAQQRAEELLSAVVHLRVKVLPDARTGRILGFEREGTGVLIDDQGHVVTIGYLVLEPDSIEVTGPDNRTVPARLVGYDHATGFGLLKIQGTLAAKPITLGDSSALAAQAPVMVLPWGGPQAATVGRVVARREFTGAWEYLLDNAIFVAPPTLAWAGAALVDREFRLVGIGSLLVRDTVPGDRRSPGNMFVPIDLLKPILADLKASGRAAGAPQPWLGLRTEAIDGRLLVTGVTEDSPAEMAGIDRGDIVLAVGPEAVATQADLYRRMWALGPAGVEVPLTIVRGGNPREVRVKSIDRATFFRSKPAF